MTDKPPSAPGVSSAEKFPVFDGPTFSDVSGYGAAQIAQALDSSRYVEGLHRSAEAALLKASELYIARVGSRAVELANAKESEVVARSDMDKAVEEIDGAEKSALKSAALFTFAGILTGGAASAVVTTILSPKTDAFWWVMGVSAVFGIVGLVLAVIALRKA